MKVKDWETLLDDDRPVKKKEMIKRPKGSKPKDRSQKKSS